MRTLAHVHVALSTLGMALALAGPARADIGPAPKCPAGQANRYHQGRYCAPIECTSDEACGHDAKCEERALCLHDRSGEPDAGKPMWEWAGYCGAAGECQSASQCVKEKFCVPTGGGGAAAEPVPPSPRGCACDAVSGSHAPGALVALGAAALALALLRRRRRHERGERAGRD